ncbi:MAG: hypothetical protein D6710_03865 [Nitrospirae bacterium]|nr:MAG: hypothetical protein D6710_03865 [Nitrospirota bacterium]
MQPLLLLSLDAPPLRKRQARVAEPAIRVLEAPSRSQLSRSLLVVVAEQSSALGVGDTKKV